MQAWQIWKIARQNDVDHRSGVFSFDDIETADDETVNACEIVQRKCKKDMDWTL